MADAYLNDAKRRRIYLELMDRRFRRSAALIYQRENTYIKRHANVIQLSNSTWSSKYLTPVYLVGQNLPAFRVFVSNKYMCINVLSLSLSLPPSSIAKIVGSSRDIVWLVLLSRYVSSSCNR